MGVIQFRCDDELQARFEAAAKRAGMNPSELGRAILEKMLPALSAEKPEEPEKDNVEQQYEERTERVYSRLTPSEYAAMEAKARAMGMSPYTWIMRLIRVSITKKPQLDNEEVKALREAVRELSYVGRNLNQVAREKNINLNAQEKASLNLIAAIDEKIVATRQHVKKVLDQNINRWL